jgi:hypothetical protein
MRTRLVWFDFDLLADLADQETETEKRPSLDCATADDHAATDSKSETSAAKVARRADASGGYDPLQSSIHTASETSVEFAKAAVKPLA